MNDNKRTRVEYTVKKKDFFFLLTKKIEIKKTSNIEQLCVYVCFLDVSSWEHSLSRFSVMNLLGITLLHAGIPILLSMLSNNRQYVNVCNK